MMNAKKFLEKNLIYLLSFFLPVLIMLLIFIVRKIYPFGEESFLHIDMYHQYFPFLSEFFHKLKEGESLFYSWNTGIGSNFLALYVYYLASPLNWLAVLVPESLLIEFMSYLVVLKIGVCGFTFSYYLKKHFNSSSLSIVFFAVFYALSGYMAAYNWNVMWLDCILLAPLIILGLERMIQTGKYKLYCITLALAILSNYYICIMICIYLVLYFLVLLISAPNKKRALWQFALYSLLAGGMAAVLLIPEIAALHYTEFSNFDFPNKLTSYFPVIDMFARQAMNVTVETGLNHWPNIYCGVAIFLLLPLYAICKKVPLKEKAPRLILLGFLLLSFSTNMLNFIWHGLNYPDSLPARQSFLYILLLLTLCFEAFQHLKEYSKSAIGGCLFGALCFLLLCQKIASGEIFTFPTFLLTFFFVSFYGILIYLYREKGRESQYLVYLALAAVIIEAGINTYVTSVPTVSRTHYMADYDSYQALLSRLEEKDDDFYRVEKFTRLTQNDGMIPGFRSASLFSSTSNAHVKNFYEKYGMRQSKVFYSYEGATPITSSLLGVKYTFSNEKREQPDGLFTLSDQEGDIYLYQNRYTLPMGYMVSRPDVSGDPESFSKLFGSAEEIQQVIKDELPDEDMDEALNPIAAQNRLAQALSPGYPIYNGLAVDVMENNKTIITVPQDSYLYAYVNNNSVKKVTAYSGEDSQVYDKLKNSYILDLGWHPAGSILTLEAEDNLPLSLSAYTLDETALDDFISSLSKNPLIVDSYDANHLEGHVKTDAAGQLILSVPYEPGWTVKVDGEEATIDIFEDTMMSLALEPGEHSISLSYYPSGLNLGLGVSIVCLLLFLTILYLDGRGHFRQKEPAEQWETRKKQP